MRHANATLTAITAILALGLTACGGDEPVALLPPTFADGDVRVVGNGSVRWEHEALSATTVDGSLSVVLGCAGSVPHNLLIEGVTDDAGDDRVLGECDGDGVDAAPVSIDIQPGTYTYYCNIPGHQAAGMEGLLTVS